jgi:hypothetical protein
MEEKKYSQFGTLSVVIMLPLVLLFTGLSIKSGLTNSPGFYGYIFLGLTFLLCGLTFYNLTIIVDDKTVSFKLGVGLVRKSYKISDLKSCTAVTNSVLYGIGIRLLPNGWLYNVSGFKAIELQFKNRKSIVRIGTDKPEEISGLIQSLIGSEVVTEKHLDRQTKNWMYPFWLIFILLIGGLVFIPNYTETKVNVGKSELIIKGVYGLTIPYSEIEQIDTISNIPRISIRTNGYAFGKTLIGNFKFENDNQAKLFIKKEFEPYLLIKSKGKVPVYINFEDKQKTIDLYNQLKTKTE